jgi:hypothetical protein
MRSCKVNVHRQSHLLAVCLEANELGIAVAGAGLIFVASAITILVTTLTNPTILGSATGFALAILLARFTACFLAMVEEAPGLSPWVVEYLPTTYRIRSASTMNHDIAMVSPQAAAAILSP